jgi:hypothetical protein
VLKLVQFKGLVNISHFFKNINYTLIPQGNMAANNSARKVGSGSIDSPRFMKIHTKKHFARMNCHTDRLAYGLLVIREQARLLETPKELNSRSEDRTSYCVSVVRKRNAGIPHFEPREVRPE